jgi:hypothetical protein
MLNQCVLVCSSLPAQSCTLIPDGGASEVPNYGAYIRARVLPYFRLTKQHYLSFHTSCVIYFFFFFFLHFFLMWSLSSCVCYFLWIRYCRLWPVSYVGDKLWKACCAFWDSDALSYAAAVLLVYLLVPTWLVLHKRSFGPVLFAARGYVCNNYHNYYLIADGCFPTGLQGYSVKSIIESEGSQLRSW